MKQLSSKAVYNALLEHNFVLIFCALILIASLLSPNFLTVQNVANLFQQAAVVGITAIGMTCVILTANIDLSVGSMVAFGGMFVAVLMKAGLPPELPMQHPIAELAWGGVQPVTVPAGGLSGNLAARLEISPSYLNLIESNRRPLPAVCLATDPVVLTCVSNDYTFDEVFSRQLEALAEPGDTVIVP